VAEEGEVMLRALVRVIHRVTQMMDLEPLEPFARTHKAETVEILGERWYSKACNSDREAVGLINPARSGPKRTEVYCYLGGGGLTEASTSHANLAQGVVVKTKSWETAVAVCVAVSLITAAVPGQTTFLENSFCATDCGESSLAAEEGEELQDAQESAEDLKSAFTTMYEATLHQVWAEIRLPPWLIMSLEEKSEADARLALKALRDFW
jgi:hypothetical protein